MKRFNLKLTATVAVAFALVGFLTTAQAFEPKVVTFDSGTEGWMPGGDCGTVIPDGGNPGAYWNVASLDNCEPNHYILQGWFFLTNVSDPAFLGDYSAKGPVRLSIDVNVNDYTYYWFGSAVEEYRQVVFEFIDHDNPYTDPDTGYSWPYTSVIYPAGYLPNRNAGWKTFNIDIPDPNATEVPEGWTGFGGPEDPTTYMPQLPPDRTFADVMAGIDEIWIHNVEPGYFYDYGFIYDVDFDNLSIQSLPQECNGAEATVWVDDEGMVHGGQYDGLPYSGELVGTDGPDVIVGTSGNDSIQGLGGNDLICGMEGNDALHGHFGDDFILGGPGNDTLIGQWGHDYLDGGEGRDVINGGDDSDTCVNGEVVVQCGEEHGNRPKREVTRREGRPSIGDADPVVSLDRN